MPDYFMVQLESQLGPDPLNRCADLAGIGGALQGRILRLKAELAQLEELQENILRGIDRFIEEDAP